MGKNGNECWRSGNGLGKRKQNFGVRCRSSGTEFGTEFRSEVAERGVEFRSQISGFQVRIQCRISEYGTESEQNFGVEIWYMTPCRLLNPLYPPEPMTLPAKNPYPWVWVQVFAGTGMGSPGIPQGYPCQTIPMCSSLKHIFHPQKTHLMTG